jgi:hypothetical protein
MNLLALVKGTERYVFLYDDASRAETLRVRREAAKAAEAIYSLRSERNQNG